jgi:hypothetical protein
LKIQQESDRLTLQDSPLLVWVLGIPLVVIGGMAIASTMGLLGGAVIFPGVARFSVSFMGLLAIAGGLIFIQRSPQTTSIFDRHTSRVVITRKGLLRSEEEHYGFNQISSIQLQELDKSESGLSYRLSLLIRGGKVTPLSRFWTSDKQHLKLIALSLADYLRKTSPEIGLSGLDR